jgi:GT2 family glycosyltransferase
MIDVSIIIVNYKTSILVKDCLLSIENKTTGISYESIVIDNSEDALEFSRLKSIAAEVKFPVFVYRADHNVGFGSANNLGAKYSHGKILFFLNSDTLLLNNAILEMEKVLTSDQKIGAVGANLYSPSRKPALSYFLKEQTIKEVRTSYSNLGVFKRHFLSKNDHFNHTGKNLEIEGYISGACLMIQKNIFWAIGGFDERIFMYGEDALLCALIRRKHFSLMNVPSACVIHLEGGSERKIFTDKKIANWVFGNYIYALTLYGESEAREYIKTLWKGESKASFRYALFAKRDDYTNHHHLVLEYKKFYKKLFRNDDQIQD